MRSLPDCTTHHHACVCREALHERAAADAVRMAHVALDWHDRDHMCRKVDPPIPCEAVREAQAVIERWST